MTQERPSGLLLTASGIQHRVPRRTVSDHPALQSVTLQIEGWPESFRRLACRVPPDLHHRTDLAPFAMWPAFPASDYYGASVAIRPPPEGLEPVRRSRVWSSGHVSSAV